MSESLNAASTQDRLSRERIRTETDKSFFVEAGAGSGKTTLLVERMTAMIRNGADISKIAAITFTKAAANEFYRRFQRSLDRSAKDASLTDAERERCRSALSNIDLCFMNTIDAFCQTVILEHPVEALVPFGCTVNESAELIAAARPLLSAALRGEYGTELISLYNDMSHYFIDPKQAVMQGIGKFLAIRHTELAMPDIGSEDTDAALADTREQLCRVINVLCAHPEYAHSGSITARGAYETLCSRRGVAEGVWSGHESRVLSMLKKLKPLELAKNVTPESAGFPTASGLFTASKTSRSKYKMSGGDSAAQTGIEKAITFLERKKYAAYLRFMSEFAARVSSTLRERGQLEFFDYKLYLRDLLREDARRGGELTRHISARHSYFLIDEFQDTDPLEAEIFFHLAAEAPRSDWKSCIPRSGSLFIVGDPKQSIYRFKHADIASFMRVRAMFGADVLMLHRNFRSVPALREWFNTTFSIEITESSYQAGFTEIPPLERDNEHIRGDIDGVYYYNVDKDSKIEAVEALIRSIVGRKTISVRRGRGEPEELRTVRYSDIMVISHGKNKGLRDLTAGLYSSGIPFYIEGCTDFSGQPLLGAMEAVFGAMAFPNDSAMVSSALECPFFGCTDAELISFIGRGGRLSLFCEYDDNEYDDNNITKALGILKALLDECRTLTPYAAYIRTADKMDELGRLDCAACPREEYFWYTAELIRRGECDGSILSIDDARQLIRELRGNVLEREMSLVRESDCVHIANLHKVKGLEAPVVILAGGVSKAHSAQTGEMVDYLSDPPRCTVFGINGSDFGTLCSHSGLYEDEELIENENSEAEKTRLDYVAATRAGNALFVAQTLKADGSRCASLYWERLLDNIPDGREYAIDYSAPDAAVQNITLSAPDDDIGRLLERCAGASYSRVLPSSLSNGGAVRKNIIVGFDNIFSDETETPSEEYSDTKRADAALRGTLIHRAMELLIGAARAGTEYSPKSIADIVTGEYELTNEQSAELNRLIVNVIKRIGRGGYQQRSGYPSDILGEVKSAERVLCELPFCVSTAPGILLDGVIDLLYLKDGQWHIVDYKTNLDGDALEEKYAGQLGAYAQALAMSSGENAVTHIYHIDV